MQDVIDLFWKHNALTPSQRVIPEHEAEAFFNRDQTLAQFRE